MSGTEQENLRELFARFLDSEAAKEAVEELRAGEQVLRDYPTPEPSEALLTGIKLDIGKRLSRGRRGGLRRLAWETIAAAGVVIVLIAVGSSLFTQEDRRAGLFHASVVPRAVWESDDIATDDLELASFRTEIEHIEDQVRVLRSGETGRNGDVAVEELEMEFADIDSDFWKG